MEHIKKIIIIKLRIIKIKKIKIKYKISSSYPELTVGIEEVKVVRFYITEKYIYLMVDL